MRVLVMLLMVLLVSGAVACESDTGAYALPEPASIGDPVLGQEVFNTGHGDAPACNTCHVVKGNVVWLAPSLEGLANRAGSRQEGLDVIAYLRQSILDPMAYDADPESPARMYEHFAQALTEEDLDNLIAYLLTLR